MKIIIPKLVLLLLVFIFSFTEVYAIGNIKGRAVDKATREPVEDAIITNIKTGSIVFSDKNGYFSFDDANGDSLFISDIGYKSTVVIAEVGKPVSVEMEKGAITLKDVVIINDATFKTYSALTSMDLNMQPAKSAQDLLRLIPGLFIAQHQGGGKAEQIFLRGFDADHGTDVAVSADGMPVNMVTHAHGQGYADLHFLIPETVAGYDFGKGPYYADKGDFNTAGYVAYNTKQVLEHDMVKIEVGQFNTLRLLAMINLLSEKARKKGTSAYVAGERLYSNGGPFILAEHFTRYNVFGKFNTQIGSASKLTFEASTLASGWKASGEIPDRAQQEGYIPSQWGALDTAQGGYTTRTNVSLKLTTDLGNNWTMENQLWYSHYFFNLISNFTFYYYFPTTGDEFRQRDERDLTGYNWKTYKTTTVNNKNFVTTFGAGYRYDNIYPLELDHTENGQFLSYLQYGKAKEINVNTYVDEKLRFGHWLFDAGLRLDYFHFYYDNLAPVSDSFATKIYQGVDPNAGKAALSPKVSVEYTFNSQFQLYAKAGKGFHSNDARVVIANQGNEILPAAYGADIGANWKPLPNLYINVALWYLYLQQEFTFGQDLIDQPGGPVTPGDKTVRDGYDFSARYQLTKWLYVALNINGDKPRNLDSAAGHNYLPLAPTLTSTGSLDYRFKNGINGGISYRYLHNRAANSTYTLDAQGYFVTDLTVNYTRKRYEIGLAIENLFNVQWDESQFEYVSQLKNEATPVDQVSYTPGVPFFAKFHLSLFF